MMIAFVIGATAHAQGGSSTHVVESGETLYAISKHYAVPISSLVASNPGSENGLRIGQTLSIPLEDAKRKDKKNAPDLVDGELIHSVKKRETIYGIARKYSVDINDLVERNPELATGLRDGMAIVVPISKVQVSNPALVREATGEEHRYHTVGSGETLYSLSRKFNVSIQRLQEANGGLPMGLAAGNSIVIPEPEVVEPDFPHINANVLGKQQEYKVSLMLPFDVNEVENSTNEGVGGLTEIALHFYFGALVALDSLKKAGIQATINVLDVGTDEARVKELMRVADVASSDLFIGPFHRTPLEAVVAIAGSKGTHVVCPVPQNNKVLLGRPHLSNVVGGRSSQVKGLAKYISMNYSRENIVLVKPAKWAEKDLQDQMERSLIQALPPDKEFVRAAFDKTTDEIQKALQLNGPNIIVVPSEDLAIVSDLITKLNSLPNSYQIILFGMENWVDFDNIDPIYKEKFNVHMPANGFVDRKDPRVIRFIKAFREKHGAEPSSFAFMGFDVTLFYLKALMEQGRDFEDRFDLVHIRPLHTSFEMTRTGIENGFTNDHVTILNYRGFELRPNGTR